ncbi:DNA polymerase V [Enterobacter mori]|uniref:DNA polymerase V n=1 Tax=Enterobacter mori TaxID=539813 RepID=UPI00398B4835
MPRQYEIESAFRNAIVIEPNGRRTVTTENFVKSLEKYNWQWSLKQANSWIECYVTTFRDVSDHEGEDRTFQLFNPNGGL